MNTTPASSTGVAELEEMLAVSERKIDILTNLLKEASAEFERSLEKVTVSESNFRAVFENAPEAILIMEAERHRILDCNPFAVEWLGYSRGQLLALRYDDILEPGSTGVQDNVRLILDQGHMQIQDRKFVKSDGTRVDAEVTGTTIEYQGRSCVVALARDVTERKKAQDALQMSEQRFRDIATSLPDWIWEVDRDWVYTYCSRGAESIIGYGAADILGKPLWEWVPPEEVQPFLEMVDQARREPRAFGLYESRRLNRDGRLVHLESSGVPLLEDTGRLVGYRGIHRDVTERKRLEEISRYKELFENVSDPVFILDFKGRFLEVNDVAVDRFGYPREKLLTMRIKDLVNPDQFEILYETGQRVRQGESIQFELEVLDERGKRVQYEFHARPIVYKGERGALSVGRDLSERKKLEQALITSERLTAVGEMASGVAHNFNNLLQMILGAADAAEAKLAAGKIRETREAIKRIQDASHRAAEVVQRIKDFTRTKDDGLEKAERAFDLGELIRESVELTQPLWKDLPDSRRYEVDLTAASRCFVRGRPSEIYEVIVNLIKNGLEAMPRGGNLAISARAEGDKVILQVTDNGYGIPGDSLPRIFEPFYTTKGPQSSGLGLSSSYGIIKRHSGEIHVQSQEGDGTTFTVTLPRADEPSFEEVAAAQHSDTTKIKFLMVDDEVNILKAMEMFFDGTEVELVTCSTAVEALKAYRQDHFDVVLCDLGMDGINGWEFGKLIKTYCREQGRPKTPFLLYTGWDRTFDPEMLDEGGVDRIVIKPLPCKDLLNILHEMVAP